MPDIYKFPYLKVSYPNLPFFYKFKNLALIKIGLASSNNVTMPQAFVDTGSQYCLFNGAYAKYLGISDFRNVPKDHMMPLIGIAGKSAYNMAYFHKVDILIYKDSKHLKNNNAIRLNDIEVGFLEKEFDIGGVLGVYGFLDRFKFTSNVHKGYFELEPIFDANY